MSIYDRLKQSQTPAQNSSPAPEASPESWLSPEPRVFSFDALPESAQELSALPEAALDSPYRTAALTVLALCAYAADEAVGAEMLGVLMGPRALSPYDKQFLRDRLRGKEYIPFSFFDGSTPENGYTPAAPFRVTVTANARSADQPGTARLFIASGGADSPRPVILREQNGRWYLYEQLLLSDIRKPAGWGGGI